MKRIRTWCMALASVFALAMQLLGATAPDWKQVTQPDTIIGYFAVSNVETKALVETDGSKLAAFAANGECRGVANVIDGPKGRFFSLSIGIASSTEKGLTLKCWDAATQTTFDVNDYEIDASVAGEQIGRIVEPVVVIVGVAPITPDPDPDPESSIGTFFGLKWTTGTEFPWTYGLLGNGYHALRSADFRTEEEEPLTGTSWIETTIEGPKTLNFSYDTYFWGGPFEVLIDDEVVLTIAAFDEQWSVVDIPAGRHRVRFSFECSDWYCSSSTFNGVWIYDLCVSDPGLLPTIVPDSTSDPETATRFTGDLVISITNDCPGSTIYYSTCNYGDATNSAVAYTGPFHITRSTVVRAYAVARDGTVSGLNEHVFIERHPVVPGEWTADADGVMAAAKTNGNLIVLLATMSHNGNTSWLSFGGDIADVAESETFCQWARENGVFLLAMDMTATQRGYHLGDGVRCDVGWGRYIEYISALEYFRSVADNQNLTTNRLVVARAWDPETSIGELAGRAGNWLGDVQYLGTVESLIACLEPLVLTRPVPHYAITYVDTKGCANTNPDSYTTEDEITFAPLAAPAGWKFLGWSPTKIAKGSEGAKTVTAQWEQLKYSVDIGGSVNDGCAYGEAVTAQAPADRIDGYAQFVCIGWTGTGDVTATGTGKEVQFTVTQDSTLTWLYQTNYWFEATATSGGSVTVAETEYAVNPSGSWIPAGATVDISASAKIISAKFTAWNDLLNGGTFSQDASLSLSMNGPYRLQAKFIGGDPSPDKDFKYTKKKGKATITGYKGAGGDVVIPKTLGGAPVTVIAEKAFYNNTSVESVYIPEGVIEIGYAAFEYCDNLISIDLPSTLVTLGRYAFGYNRKLTAFSLVDGNEHFAVVDGVLFSSDLKKLVAYPAGRGGECYVLPESVEAVGDYAFEGASTLESLVIPASVSEFASTALWGLSIERLIFEGRCGTSGMTKGLMSNARTWVKSEDYDYWTGIFGLGISVIEAEGTTYDIVFDANGGEGDMFDIYDVAHGSVTNLPTCTFENASAPIFFGWALTPDGDVAIADEAEVSSLAQEDGAVVTLYAVWSSCHVRAGEAGTIAAPESTLISPTWSAKGLPNGLKIAAKSNSVSLNGAYLPGGTIYGTATAPGTYVVKVTAKSGTKRETFNVPVTVGNYVDEELPLEDRYDAQVGVKFLVELGEEFAGANATGLPAGLKFAAKLTKDKDFGEVAAGTIYGVPTKACTNAVIFTEKVGKKIAHKASATFAIAAAPVWSIGTFNGQLDDCSGSVTLTVAASGKISGKVVSGGKTWSFSSSGYDTNEYSSDEREIRRDIIISAKSVNLVASVQIAVCDGSVTGSIASEEVDDDGDLLIDSSFMLWRNEWKDKGATDKLKVWAGLYTVQISSDDSGYGYLSLTLDTKGNCKATGKLPDGTSASATLPIVWNEDVDAPMAIWQVSPSAYKGGYVGGQLAWGLGENAASAGDDAGEVRLDATSSLRQVTGDNIAWASFAPTASIEYGYGFSRTLSASGAYYNKLAALTNYYSTLAFGAELPTLDVTVKTIDFDENDKRVTTSELNEMSAAALSCWNNLSVSLNKKGTAFVVNQGKATKPVQDKTTKDWLYDGDNDAALTFSFTKTTGIFKGTFTCWYDYTSITDYTKDPMKETSTHTSKKVSYEGAMVLGEPLRGFYLWDRVGTYHDEKTDKDKTYKYKESRAVEFGADGY